MARRNGRHARSRRRSTRLTIKLHIGITPVNATVEMMSKRCYGRPKDKPMTTVIATILLFAMLLVGMSLGIILSDRKLKGTCGGESVRGPDGLPMLCGACPKKRNDLCPTDNPFAAVAMVGNPARTINEHTGRRWNP